MTAPSLPLLLGIGAIAIIATSKKKPTAKRVEPVTPTPTNGSGGNGGTTDGGTAGAKGAPSGTTWPEVNADLKFIGYPVGSTSAHPPSQSVELFQKDWNATLSMMNRGGLKKLYGFSNPLIADGKFGQKSSDALDVVMGHVLISNITVWRNMAAGAISGVAASNFSSDKILVSKDCKKVVFSDGTGMAWWNEVQPIADLAYADTLFSPSTDYVARSIIINIAPCAIEFPVLEDDPQSYDWNLRDIFFQKFPDVCKLILFLSEMIDDRWFAHD